MNKIPTLFVRDAADRAHVTREVNPGCGWVLDGEGVATQKYDGTCTMFDGARWWARREVKPGKSKPAGFIPLSTDEVTGKTVGWEPVEQSSFAKFHAQALSLGTEYEPDTYELCGPKVNGNPEQCSSHMLIRHGRAIFADAPRDYDGLRDFLLQRPSVEGLVFHHSDGRMVKIKRRDFA